MPHIRACMGAAGRLRGLLRAVHSYMCVHLTCACIHMHSVSSKAGKPMFSELAGATNSAPPATAEVAMSSGVKTDQASQR